MTTKFYHLPQRKAFDEKAKMREPVAKSLLRLSLKASLRRVLAAHEPGRNMWAEPGRPSRSRGSARRAASPAHS